MKYLFNLFLIALFSLCIFTACNNDGDAARDAAVDSVAPAPADGTATPGATPAATPAPTQEPPQNTAGIWHYTCPKGCEGGSGSAIACPKCGTTLTHNQTYHANASNTTAAPPITVGGGNEMTPMTTPPPTQEPAQNAKGVWHYTCPKGCDGGAGTATACAKCGSTLAHNKVYHQ